MKLAFQHLGDDFWITGNIVLEDIFVALRALGDEALALALVVGQATPQDHYRTLLPYVDEVIAAPLYMPDPQWLARQSLRAHAAWWFQRRILRRPPPEELHPLSAVLPSHHVDCFFSIAWTHGALQSTPYIVWIPDFQHVHLPEMFEPGLRAARDQIYSSQAQWADRVMVKSEAVRRDFETYLPAHAAKARVVPYVPHLPPAVYDRNPCEALAAYHLPERFFYLPNQFWQHKNHRVVLEALRLLGEHSIRPIVVSTGSTVDFRNPGYFGDLIQKLSLWNLRDQFIYLGMTPRENVFALMRQALCVLNPSLFEGYGMSAAECRLLGKRALLSDLPALREQNPPGAIYFDPRDARDLADKMEMIWQTAAPGPDATLEAEARAACPGRQLAFGQAFLRLVQEAVAEWKDNPHGQRVRS